MEDRDRTCDEEDVLRKEIDVYKDENDNDVTVETDMSKGEEETDQEHTSDKKTLKDGGENDIGNDNNRKSGNVTNKREVKYTNDDEINSSTKNEEEGQVMDVEVCGNDDKTTIEELPVKNNDVDNMIETLTSQHNNTAGSSLTVENNTSVPHPGSARRFISDKKCIDIVNFHGPKVIRKWLKLCHLTTTGITHKNRQALLGYIDKVKANKATPSAAFITGFTEKLLAAAVDEELDSFDIEVREGANINEKRHALRQVLMTLHGVGTNSKKNFVGKAKTNNNKKKVPNDNKNHISVATNSVKHKSTMENTVSTKNLIKDQDENTDKKKPAPKMDKERKVKASVKSENVDVIKPGKPKQTLQNEMATGLKTPQPKTKDDNPAHVYRKLEKSLEILQENIIKMNNDQIAQKQITKDELRRQQNCIDLLLKEDHEKKKKHLSDWESCINRKLQPLEEKLRSLDNRVKELEVKLSQIGETNILQSETLNRWIDGYNNKDEALNRDLQIFSVDINVLRQKQNSLLGQLNALKTDIKCQKNADDRTNITPSNQTNNNHITTDITPQVSHVGKADQSTQTQSIGIGNVADSLNTPVQMPNTHKTIKQSLNEDTGTKKQATRITKYHHRPAEKTINDENDCKITNDLTSATITKESTSNYRNSGQHSVDSTKVPKHDGNHNSNTSKNVSSNKKSTATDNKVNREEIRPPPKTSTNKGTDQSPKITYRSKKFLLVHDSTYNDFDQSKFSNELDVHTYYSKSVMFLSKDGKLKSLINKLKPECIYIHVGI